MGVMNSSIQDSVWTNSLLHLACKDIIGIIPSSIPALLHFILVSVAEIIFYFHGIHEQFHIGCCVWNVSLLDLAHKVFIGIIPFSIPAFFLFILVSIAEIIFYFHGIHEHFHIGCCVWNVSFLHLARKDFMGIIPSSILAFLDFIVASIFHGIHEQFDIGYAIIKCVLYFQYLHQTRSDCFYLLKKIYNKIVSLLMPPTFIASIIISVPTYNLMLHASFISVPQYKFNATK